MRRLAISLIASLAIGDLGGLHAVEPQVRPALIGNGPKALINLVDTEKLMKKGQGDALMNFQCLVSTSGQPVDPVTYRATPGAGTLEKEVMSALQKCRFIPAIYDGTPTEVLFLGTVVFIVADGKAHLRIYANQNHDDIATGSDFIAPQLILESRKKISLVQNELEKARIYHQNGVVELSTTVDANGNQEDIRVVSEDPPGFNFGRAELELSSGAKYIPGFRNGGPVDCTFDQYFWFFSVHRR
jgi:TonB-like protein